MHHFDRSRNGQRGDRGNPIDTHGGQTNATGSAIIAPTITTTVGDELLVGAFGMASNPAIAPAAGMLEQFEILASGKNKAASEFADQITPTPGATGSRSATADKSAASIGQLIALRPSDAVPPPPDTTPPTPPTNVAATAASQTRVDLTWTASNDAVGVHHYEVYRDGGSTPIGTSTVTSFADLTVVASTTYTYTVRALDAIGNASDPSTPPASVTTPDPPPPPTPITFRGASTGANRSATTLTISRPVGIVANDVLLVSVDLIGTATITPPAGWTLVRQTANGSAMTKATYLKVAVAGEPASYTWTFSVARLATGTMLGYGGVDTVNPIDVTGGQANASSSTVASPSVAQTVTNGVLVGFFGIATNATFSPPSGMTERGEVTTSDGSSKLASEVADEVHLAPGPIGTRAATCSKAAVSIGQIVILRPAGP